MEPSQLRTHLSEDFVNEKRKMPFPCVLLKNIGEEFPLVMEALEEGDLCVVVQSGGKTICLDKRINRSALNIRKLCTMYEFDVLTSPEQTDHVSNVEQYMEVLLSWMLH